MLDSSYMVTGRYPWEQTDDSLEGGFAAQGLDDVTVSLVAPGGPMLNQAQHSLKVTVGRG